MATLTENPTAATRETATPRSSRPTRYTPRKHDRRRDELVAIASAELNEHGVRGLVMADVAAKAGMSKANLTYYFRRKEDLAERCFDAAIDAYRAMIADAAEAPSPRERVASLIARYIDRASAAITEKQPPLAILSDIRALEEAYQTRAVERYSGMLHEAAALIERTGRDTPDIFRTVPRAQLMLVQLFWSAAWLPNYAPSDHPGVARRLTDIVLGGISHGAPEWQSEWSRDAARVASRDHSGGDRSEFFRTATRLINRLGYHGASVDRIAAEMQQTKGAIYHHFESKDALLLACFERSFAQMWGVIGDVAAISDDPKRRLHTTVAALIAFQVGENGPFLRDTALTALPMDTRLQVLAEWNRITLHIASLVTDAIAAGCGRPVDALLAAQAIAAGINAAEEINRFIPEGIVCDVAELCARPLLFGLLFDDPAAAG